MRDDETRAWAEWVERTEREARERGGEGGGSKGWTPPPHPPRPRKQLGGRDLGPYFSDMDLEELQVHQHSSSHHHAFNCATGEGLLRNNPNS